VSWRAPARTSHTTVNTRKTAACNALHSAEQRACKWLLMTHDRVFTNQFKLTHEFLALMLGVTRPTISVIAGQLQERRLIEYHRGHVTILDREGLEGGACECYALVKKAFDDFLPQLETV
jgi:CRP-like cAMP-binding protein